MYLKLLLSSTILLTFTACAKESKLPAKCYEKGETGKCRAYFIKYNFNQETNKCEKYVYGGCGKVVFNTLEECKKTCKE